MTQSTKAATVDLSYAGVDNILDALAEAGVPPHYNETDGETFIDIQLVDLDADTATALSWRDSEGWRLRAWNSNDTAAKPDRAWSIVGVAGPGEVAREVASILGIEPKPTPAEPTGLLADPAQVAAVRYLIAAARQAGAEHYTYAFNDCLGHPIASQEHVWALGLSTVSYEDGRLMYERNDRNGAWLLKAHTTDARQVGPLLAAIGALPTELSSAYVAGLNDGGPR